MKQNRLITNFYSSVFFFHFVRKPADGGRYFRGSAVLIHKNYVLTSSYCVNGNYIVQSRYSLMSVRLGDWDTSTDIDCNDDKICAPPPQDIPIVEMIPHDWFLPNSNSATESDNIALLRLERPATFTNYVRPICLPFDSLVANKNFDGKPMIFAGWGLTETCKSIKLLFDFH